MGSGRRGGLTRPTLAAFGLAALLVAAVFAVLLGAVSRVRDESRELERTERTVALSSRLLRNTVDLETGIRGRLLTGDPRYLAPYEDAQRAIPGVLAELDATVTDPAARARFEDLRGRVQGFRTGYARAAAGAPLDLSAARRRALVDEGRRLLDDLRARFDGFRTQEEERTRAKSDDTDASVDRAIAIAVGGLAVVLALLGVLAAFTRGRIRREAQAAQERAAAEEASRMKSSFLANMSHEIRTPLNGVIGMTDLLLDTPLSAEQREYATTARASGEQLLAVINDILDVSKIEAGHLEVEDRDFDLRDTVESTCDGLAAAAHVKGVELAVLIGDDVPRAVRGDRTRVAQVLTNLVSNAVKFTPEGEVVVDVAVVARDTARTTVGFAVTDTGIGIEPRAIERLFDAFSQGDVSTTRRFGGTGLGLAISRQLVELMGGEISARSTPGQGSTFSFTIPFPPAEDEPLQVAPRAELRGLKVLAVDDTQVNRRVLEAYLSSWGMRVTCAADGETALASLHGAVRRGEPYDVALLDFNMPGMDGVQLAAAISAAPALRGTRLVMLTSSGTGMQEAREAGVAEFLTKPVRQSRLYDAIASAMHRASGNGHAAPAPPVPEAGRAAGGALILVAEDHDVNRLLIERLLARRGHRTVVAGTGGEAIELSAREPVAMVFMDCQMPEVDGYEATRRIRERESAAGAGRIPIVAMTAHAMAGDRERCLAAGMDDYLAKPLDAGDVDAVLARWLGNPETVILDDDRFDDLARDFPPEVVREVVGAFLDSTPSIVERVVLAAEGEDHQEVAQGAHRLKGGCLAVGARAMNDVAAELERLGRDGAGGAALRDAAQRLEASWGLTRTALRERLA